MLKMFTIHIILEKTEVVFEADKSYFGSGFMMLSLIYAGNIHNTHYLEKTEIVFRLHLK